MSGTSRGTGVEDPSSKLRQRVCATRDLRDQGDQERIDRPLVGKTPLEPGVLVLDVQMVFKSAVQCRTCGRVEHILPAEDWYSESDRRVVHPHTATLLAQIAENVRLARRECKRRGWKVTGDGEEREKRWECPACVEARNEPDIDEAAEEES